jgi:DNA invertase Pin-like site-specific DNA recombinase
MSSAIAYVRISSKEKPEGEVGMDAQLAQIREFAEANGYRIAKTFRDHTSEFGKPLSQTRPGLYLAVGNAKKLNCPVIVSEFPRLDVAAGEQLSKIVFSYHRVQILSAKPGEHPDNADARAEAAQRKVEREKRSEAAKAALGLTKAQAVKLGNPRLGDAQRRGSASVKKNAAFRAYEQSRLIAQAKAAGAKTAHDIATKLNEAGHRTAQGKEWTAGNVHQIRRKIKARANSARPKPAPSFSAKPAIFDPDGVLTLDGLGRFNSAMAVKGYKPGATGKLMKDMKFNPHDVSIRPGLLRMAPMKIAFRDPLQTWIEEAETGQGKP